MTPDLPAILNALRTLRIPETQCREIAQILAGILFIAEAQQELTAET
jgi:myosin heavy subunit